MTHHVAQRIPGRPQSPRASAYYNEIDPFKAEVLRQAIHAGGIAHGDVDERSIADVRPADLMGYTQCHFFAGGGFWSLALRQAGWPDDRPVWTGSCPCPSFSSAGKGAGFADPRHLWPEWFRLIRECRPRTIFGEQVAAAIGHGWLDLVCTDVEEEGYAIASAVLGAHSVGAPHIRQRVFFLADSGVVRPQLQQVCGSAKCAGESLDRPSAHRATFGRMDQPLGAGLEGHVRHGRDGNEPGRNGADAARSASETGVLNRPSQINGFWRDADWIGCRDRKWRAVPGTTESWPEQMADGSPDDLGYFLLPGRSGYAFSPLVEKGRERVGRLKMYGDAICVPVAQAFIAAAMEIIEA